MEKIFNKLNNIRSAATFKKSVKKNLARVESLGSQPRIIGYRQYLSDSAIQKKALLSYLVQPVIDELSGIRTPLFSNSGAGRTIPKVLNKMGYVVDVINWDDTLPIKGEYDLVVYHGGKNFNQIKKLKNPNNKLVYYSTGSYWEFHNSEEKKRLEYFKKRHNKTFKLDREIKNSEEEANSKADAIIVLGNADTANTYSKFKHVHSLEGASMPVSHPRSLTPRQDGKMGFLFMAGPGNLHKGLDIVLDAWSQLPETYELHIITYLDPEFEKYYQKALYNTPNIKTHGYVQQRSKKFYEIIAECQYSILMSCSEGSPGSVIESMHQGLIPIVTKESHISIPVQGYTVNPGVDSTIKLLKNLSGYPTAEKQHVVREWAEEEFTISGYERNLKVIIGKIIK